VTSIERFRALLRIPTISRLEVDEIEWEHFDRFIAEVRNLYPKLHEALELEIVAGHSLLFRWPGAEAGSPSVLMAHYDVVPATEDRWEHPPFAAELTGEGDDLVLWSRGTLDDKGALVSILEAVESQVANGFTPKNDIYLSFGHNEETFGDGASTIVDLLEERGVAPALVLDEGGAVVEGIFPGVTDPIAVVGVSEKGTVTVQLTVQQQGGHASTPPKLSATARLARAIIRLNKRPFRRSFTPTNLEMIRTIGDQARHPYRWIFRNVWLTRLPLLSVFSRLGDESNAMIRTTSVVTRLAAGLADNAMAETATATVNVRVAVDSTSADALRHIKSAIRDDAVDARITSPGEPSPISPTTGAEWDLVKATIETTYPGTIVTPYIMLGGSDGRHFTRISDTVYRFSPFAMSLEERGTLHAINERIHVATWLKGIAFYETLIRGL
jgi:carboxypeptidase PM20D1